MESMKKIDSSQSGSNKRLANAYSSNIKDSELMYLLTSKGNAKVKNDFKDHTKIVSIPNSTKTFIKKKTIISPSIIQSLNLHGFKKPLRSESRIKLFIIIAFINKPNQRSHISSESPADMWQMFGLQLTGLDHTEILEPVC